MMVGNVHLWLDHSGENLGWRWSKHTCWRSFQLSGMVVLLKKPKILQSTSVICLVNPSWGPPFLGRFLS